MTISAAHEHVYTQSYINDLTTEQLWAQSWKIYNAVIGCFKEHFVNREFGKASDDAYLLTLLAEKLKLCVDDQKVPEINRVGIVMFLDFCHLYNQNLKNELAVPKQRMLPSFKEFIQDLKFPLCPVPRMQQIPFLAMIPTSHLPQPQATAPSVNLHSWDRVHPTIDQRSPNLPHTDSRHNAETLHLSYSVSK